MKVVFALLAGLAIMLSSCANAKPARAPLRAGIITMAYAVKVGVGVCNDQIDQLVKENKVTEAKQFGMKCESLLTSAKEAVVQGAEAIDTWSSAKAPVDVACSVSKSSKAIGSFVNFLAEAGVKIPDEISDTLAFTQPLAAACAQ